MLICLLLPLATEQSLGVPSHCLEKFPGTFQWQIPHSLTLAKSRHLEFNKGSGTAEARFGNLVHLGVPNPVSLEKLVYLESQFLSWEACAQI